MDEVQAKVAIPWYKSRILQGAAVSVISKLLVMAGLPTELGGGDVANLVVGGIGLAADALIVRSRVKQTQPAIIAATKAHAELLEQVKVVPQAEIDADRVANAALGFEIAEPFPAQATAADSVLEHAPATPVVDEFFEREIMFGSLVDDEFKDGVLWIEEKLGLSADNLMCCMHFETGGTFSSTVKNAAGSSGLGLIQFMRATIEGPQGMLAKNPELKKYARTHADLAKLTAVQQLSFVYFYFKAFGNDLSHWALDDTYMAILFPRAIGKSPNWPMPWAAGSLAYKQNSGLDLNKDKVITKAEAAAGVTKRLALGEQLKG